MTSWFQRASIALCCLVLVTWWDTFGTMLELLFGLFLATLSHSLELLAVLVGVLHLLMIRATKQQVNR